VARGPKGARAGRRAAAGRLPYKNPYDFEPEGHIGACACVFSASAYLALLPLLARHLISEGPQLYGILLAAIGVGTVGGSLIIRWLKDELGPDRLVAAGP
jgi:Transmembrane secretion effector